MRLGTSIFFLIFEFPKLDCDAFFCVLAFLSSLNVLHFAPYIFFGTRCLDSILGTAGNFQVNDISRIIFETRETAWVVQIKFVSGFEHYTD